MSTARLIPSPPLRVSEYERIKHTRKAEQHSIRCLSWGLAALGVFIVSLTVILTRLRAVYVIMVEVNCNGCIIECVFSSTANSTITTSGWRTRSYHCGRRKYDSRPFTTPPPSRVFMRKQKRRPESRCRVYSNSYLTIGVFAMIGWPTTSACCVFIHSWYWSMCA